MGNVAKIRYMGKDIKNLVYLTSHTWLHTWLHISDYLTYVALLLGQPWPGFL